MKVMQETRAKQIDIQVMKSKANRHTGRGNDIDKYGMDSLQ